MIGTAGGPADTVSPVLTLALSNDTGSSDSDGITSNPTVEGTAIDDRGVVLLLGALNPTVPEDFQDITSELQADGSFTLNATGLSDINGGSLPDGAYVLVVAAVDAAGNEGEALLSFTLDTVLDPPTLELDPASDTEPVGDGETTLATVTLVGTTEVGATVTLQENGATATADMAGEFRFTGIPLALGANSFTISATDLAGNTALITAPFTRIPEDLEPPSVAIRLANDTGSSSTDRLTSDATISGTATDNVGVTVLEAGFDQGGSVSFSSILDALQPDGSFTLDPSRLATILGSALTDGSYTLQVKAADAVGNEALTSLSFTLKTSTATPTLDLAPVSDTDPVGDQETILTPVTLDGEAEANATITLQPNGLTTTANASGQFVFTGIDLELGANNFTVTSTDAAGNQASFSTTITRIQGDTTAPALAAGLANDTGSSITDGITSAPTITGMATDDEGIAVLEAGFEVGGSTTFTSILDTLQPDGSFLLDPSKLVTILGSALVDGPYTLQIRAADAASNETSRTVTFQLDTTAPSLTLELDPASDTPPTGDNETTLPQVTIQGQTEADLTVKLLPPDITTPADVTGSYSFSNVALQLGANTFTAETADVAGNTQQASLTVTRLEVIQPPTDIELSNNTVPENSPAGTVIGSLTTIGDPDSTYTYALVTNPDSLFQIIGNELQVAPGAELNFEVTPSYSVTIRTTDDRDSNLLLDKDFTIEITNVNEAPTQILLSNNTLPENRPAGTVVGEFNNVDPDTTDSHTYTLVDDAGGRFVISGTELHVAEGADLDFETTPTLSITVRSTDSGGLSVEDPFTITLTNVNEAPFFTSTPIPNAEVGQPYSYTITTSDPESDPRTITTSTLPSWLSFTDNGDGTALLTGTPSSADTGIYSLILTVTDDGCGLPENFDMNLHLGLAWKS
ncbi:MAG: hypothetical protein HC921_17860, partial [Synechococcaceae cyanobacterium SM2_3_1]|nr:hypothetical protein [Synechococcaceae cyanobacterium SM2_3_1]